MRKQAKPAPHKRNGIWYLIRRVPAEFAQLDRRRIVRISTDIRVADDPKGMRARPVVERLADDLEIYWRGLKDGQSAEARIRFEAAQKRARALGIAYRTVNELGGGQIEELLSRVQLLIDKHAVDSESEVAAILGGETKPSIRLSGLLAEYEALQSTKFGQMSEGQARKWRTPKKRAVANLISVVTDKAITDFTRSDALTFRRWWQDRVLAEELDIGTANKDFGHISKMMRTVEMAHELGLQRVFANLRIEGAIKKQRAAFTIEHVAKKILAPGALDTLNEEARDILYVVAEHGLRLSEAANLDETTIFLDAAIPYVRIEPIGRVLKTEQSERDVPLVGYALDAMKRNPKGFPRYRDKANSLSALVNKVLDGKGLLPTDNHSFYSLRHTFEDRLTVVEAPEKVIASLMGHKWIRPKYGAGPSLAQKQEWMLRIAFKQPGHDSPPS